MSMDTMVCFWFFSVYVCVCAKCCSHQFFMSCFLHLYFEYFFFLEWWKRNKWKRPKKRNCFILSLCLHLKRLSQNIHSHSQLIAFIVIISFENAYERERERKKTIFQTKKKHNSYHVHTVEKNLRFGATHCTQWFFVLFSTTTAAMKTTISSTTTTTRTSC